MEKKDGQEQQNVEDQGKQTKQQGKKELSDDAIGVFSIFFIGIATAIMILILVISYVDLKLKVAFPPSLPNDTSSQSQEEDSEQEVIPTPPVEKIVYRYVFGSDNLNDTLEEVEKNFPEMSIRIFCGEDVWNTTSSELKRGIGTSNPFGVPREQWCREGGVIEIMINNMKVLNKTFQW